MNWDRIEGDWTNAKGRIREQWGKLTNDDLDRIAGKRDQLIGLIQQRYGMAKEVIERELDKYQSTYSDVPARDEESAHR
jgi:uncharacterized protein YjbJ (UPF0337 family)